MIQSAQTNDGASDPVLGLIDHARAQTEHTRQVLDSTVSQSPPPALAGYTIVREVHRGGQGVVYEATQDGTGRRVAIKLLRDGSLAGKMEQTRFRREVAVLAQFRHPNIVRMYDGGTADGHPYYVMDYVDGAPLEVYVRERECSVRQTLELTRKIALAVHAAHLKGIVHRDLKPSNIRVDREGEPHILDFGLAKLTALDAPRPPNDASLTLAGQFMGSLPWAAPEQIDGAADRVDIRTDVYSLGVVLFQVITERFPYDVVGTMRVVMDNILHVEPPRPSTLRSECEDDVDTIILKCLSKERERRYQSAGELARDLERYLNSEPIEAKRDSTWYVLSKGLKRHRFVATAAGLVLLLTVAYAVTMTGMYRRATLARQESVLAASKAEHEARELQAVLGSIVRTASQKLGGIAGAQDVRKELNEIAYRQLTRLAGEHGDTSETRSDLAKSHLLLADVADAIGDYPAANEHVGKALSLREQLAAVDLASATVQADLSISLVRCGDIAGRLQRPSEQLSWYERALVIDQELVRREPGNSHFLDNLAWSYDRLARMYRSQGHPDLAKEYHEKMRHLAEGLVANEPDNAIRLWALFRAKTELLKAIVKAGDWPSVVAEVESAMPIGKRIVELEPFDPFFLETIAREFVSFAWLLGEHGDPRQADAIVDESEALLERLIATQPPTPVQIPAFVTIYSCKASLAKTLGDQRAERQAVERGFGLLSEADKLVPDDPYILSQLALFTGEKARLAHEFGDAAESHALAQEAVGLAHRALADPNARKEALEACGAVLDGIIPTEFRDTSAGVAAMDRIEAQPDHNADAAFLVSLTNALAADGQLDRARAVRERALALLPPDESYFRPRLLRAIPLDATGPETVARPAGRPTR